MQARMSVDCCALLPTIIVRRILVSSLSDVLDCGYDSLLSGNSASAGRAHTNPFPLGNRGVPPLMVLIR